MVAVTAMVVASSMVAKVTAAASPMVVRTSERNLKSQAKNLERLHSHHYTSRQYGSSIRQNAQHRRN
jgi:hypothetical protein